MIFSTVRAPHEPALTVGSLATTSAGRPSTRPCPVTTPSAGSPVASAFASCPSSTKRACVEAAARSGRGRRACAAPRAWPPPSPAAPASPRAPRASPCPHGAFTDDRQAEAAGDQHALHLGRALADLEDLRVAVEPGDRELLHEAVAAEHLGGDAGRGDRGLGRVQLGDRGRLLDLLGRAAGVLERGRLVGEQPRGLDRDGEVGERNATPCRAPIGAPNVCRSFAYSHATASRQRLRQPDRQRGDRDAAVVEHREELLEAVPARAEQVRLRHPAVVEGQPVGVARCASRACRRPARR